MRHPIHTIERCEGIDTRHLRTLLHAGVGRAVMEDHLPRLVDRKIVRRRNRPTGRAGLRIP